ncbi:MAG: hypothetical protein AAB495_03305 [Patescibacteria group bacterium]
MSEEIKWIGGLDELETEIAKMKIGDEREFMFDGAIGQAEASERAFRINLLRKEGRAWIQVGAWGLMPDPTTKIKVRVRISH